MSNVDLCFKVGDAVRKVGGSYQVDGIIKAAFHADDGSARYVFGECTLYIYTNGQKRLYISCGDNSVSSYNVSCDVENFEVGKIVKLDVFDVIEISPLFSFKALDKGCLK